MMANARLAALSRRASFTKPDAPLSQSGSMTAIATTTGSRVRKRTGTPACSVRRLAQPKTSHPSRAAGRLAARAMTAADRGGNRVMVALTSSSPSGASTVAVVVLISIVRSPRRAWR